MGIHVGAVKSKISGVVVLPLKVFRDERGAVLHMLRCDWPEFTGFGEAYFSLVNFGAVKAWKMHRRQTQRLTVPVGAIRLVIHDDRADSATRGRTEEHRLSVEDGHRLIIIPPLLWYGFQGLSAPYAVLANCADLPHDPSEVESAPWEGSTLRDWWRPAAEAERSDSQ